MHKVDIRVNRLENLIFACKYVFYRTKQNAKEQLNFEGIEKKK